MNKFCSGITNSRDSRLIMTRDSCFAPAAKKRESRLILFVICTIHDPNSPLRLRDHIAKSTSCNDRYLHCCFTGVVFLTADRLSVTSNPCSIFVENFQSIQPTKPQHKPVNFIPTTPTPICIHLDRVWGDIFYSQPSTTHQYFWDCLILIGWPVWYGRLSDYRKLISPDR